MEENNFATIMKYIGRDGKIHFVVEDNLQNMNMVDRHCYMDNLKVLLMERGDMKKHLYTKEVILF